MEACLFYSRCVFRIHFTGVDLVRTRILREPDPMWETTLSVHVLGRRCEDPLLAGWRHRSHQMLRPGGPARQRVNSLIEVNQPVGDFPDFLTPGPGEPSIGAGLAKLRETPKAQLKRDMARVARTRGRLTAEPAEVAAGSPAALQRLSDSMQAYFDLVVAPRWDWVTAAFNSDQGKRAQQVLAGGLTALLDGLHPSVRFHDSVLHILDYPGERDLVLGGRGLVLVPSFFKMGHKPLTLIDDDLPPVLVYPVDRSPGVVSGRRESLSALLGRSRATTLELCVTGGTTTSIASKLNMSPASVSEHLTVLRQAGLVISVRDRNRVVHSLTPLGRTLLDGS